ncbi:MAG: alpha/beta hydrolase [Firmicutes bacterium]|nr:alpha/beta hydrolase [Bacillota bacterium]
MLDIRLHYEEKGKGFPLILLHGNGEDHTYFVHQIEYFSQYYRVIALDSRGHGMSERGSKPFTIAQFGEDVYDFMEEQGIEKAHVLGFSDGGNIALTLALNHPEKIEKMILSGANMYPAGVKKSIQIPLELEYYWMCLFNKNSKKKDFYALMVHEPRFTKKQLSQIQIPTLVMAGNHDMIQDKHTRLIAQCLPNSKLCILEGDHFIANKEYVAFNTEVKRFLES